MDENKSALTGEAEGIDPPSCEPAGYLNTEKTGTKPAKDFPVSAFVMAMAAAFLLALLLGLGIYTYSIQRQLKELRIQMNTAKLTLQDPMGEEQEIAAQKNDPVEIPAEPEHPGLTCLGWFDEAGSRVLPGEIQLSENMNLQAKYMPALGSSHEPYLFPDEYGFFNLNLSLTRGKAAEIIGRLIQDESKGNPVFSDLQETDAAYGGAAILKQYGIIQGNVFSPQQEITGGEFLRWISCFFPQPQKEFSFEDLAENSECYPAFCLAAEREWIEYRAGMASGAQNAISIAEAVQILNRAMGRQFDGTGCGEPLQLGLVEYTPESRMFAELAEAAIPHSCRADEQGEHWTRYSALEVRPADGRYVIGNRLRIVQDGVMVRSAEFDGLLFDAEGYYTSGDAELDALVLQKLNELVPGEELTREEKLRVVFDYCKNDFQYRKQTIYKNDGVNDWWKDAAKIILQTGKGNCFNYNSAFSAMGRQLGYPFRMHAGQVGRNYAYHGWPTVEIDGQTYLYDPELEMRYSSKGHKNEFFALEASQLRRYNYYEVQPQNAA
ncbi:MAG: S-layer homology domain-containing protein [Oscillospiraceae bacterium]|nr:S-layer homology domain-containing protein [Oscillospiraceae bacterium]